MPYHALIMLLAGIGIPVLAALNAALGMRLGSPASAALILFTVALISCVFVVLATGLRGFQDVIQTPKHLFLAGVLIAFYVLSITYIAPSFGVGSAVFFVLLGQLVSAAAIDHFSLFGAQGSPLTLSSAAGIALMAAGVFLTQKV